MTRKDFLRRSVYAAAGLTLLSCGSDGTTTAKTESTTQPMPTPLPYLDAIGLQLWSVRDQLELDARTTLEALAEMGYQQVELMDTRQAAELAPICKELNLAVNSSFINWYTVTGNWQNAPEETPFEFAAVMDQAGEHGLSHLIFGYLSPAERTSADDWKRVADQINEAADRAKSQGLQMAYHNHNFEWDPVEGTTGWNILVERLEPELVPFELDVFWAALAGQDPVELMRNNKNRLELLHLKQLNPAAPTVTTIAETPPDAFEELPDGELPILEYMHLGEEYGVRHCMVEQDGNYAGTSLESVRKSVEYLMEEGS